MKNDEYAAVSQPPFGSLSPTLSIYGIGVVAFYGKGQARTKRQNDPHELFPHQRSDWHAQSDRDPEKLLQLVPGGGPA